MSLTKSQTRALEWLRDRGGDAVRVGPRGQQILAAGDIAPFFYTTFFKMMKLGLIEKYGEKRIRLTQAHLTYQKGRAS